MALTEMSTEQRKEEQKRKRFIANAWALLEKTGQAPAPSKDYCQLVVTTEGVVWRYVEIKFLWLRGQGGFDLAKVEIEFSIVSNRGECQIPDAFYWIKKILILAIVIEFQNLENTGNYTTRKNFKRKNFKMDIFGI